MGVSQPQFPRRFDALVKVGVSETIKGPTT